MDLLKGQDWTPVDRSIDTLVGRLRKKIERDPEQPSLIKTVRRRLRFRRQCDPILTRPNSIRKGRPDRLAYVAVGLAKLEESMNVILLAGAGFVASKARSQQQLL